VSAEGITVGATGVVNAGAINLVTPTQTGVNSMFDSGNTVKDTFDPTTLLTGGMTINPSGTISVAGTLNAVDGVVMSAGTIEVKNTVGPNDTDKGARILTKDNLDFSSLVNIEGVANSGMSGGTLTATPGMGGDIVLAAVATSTGKAASDQVLAAAGYKERDAKISVEQGTSISSRGGVTLSATAVNKDKSFSDIRDLNLRELNSWIPEGSNPLGEVVFLSATADVDGAITGTNVDISATTFNQYASTNDADSWSNISAQGRAASQFAQNSFGWIEKMQNTFRVTPIYSYRDSEAKVNIGEHAVLTATQAPNVPVSPGSEDVLPSGISAKASATTVNVTIAATSIDSSYVNPNQHAPQPGEEEPDVTPVHRLTGATVVYAADANDVAVNIADGAKLDAQGDITVDASASDMMIGMGIVASMDPTAGQTYVDTAVVIGDAKNQAAVSVGQGASLTSSEGAVNLSAGASNSTDLGAIVAASSDSVSATAVTIYNQDSAAKVSVEGALSGKNGVSVSASDTTTRNNISANNAMMGFPPPPDAQRGANANIEQDDAQAFLQGDENEPGPVVQAVEQSALQKAKEKAEKALSLLGKYATVGASVAVANEAHTAEIALGNTAALTAENGAVSLDAKTQMNQGTNMTAMGTLMNLNPANASTAEIDAAVLVANIENDAKITVADGTVDQHAVLSGTSVSVNAASEHDWGRIDGIIADYERIFNAIKTAMEDIQTTYGTLTDDEKDLVDKLAQFEKTAQDVRQAATLSIGLDLNNYVGNGVTSMPTSVMGLFEDIVSMGAAMQRIDAARGNHYRYEIQTINQSINDFCTKFLKPENYGNFVA
ncbi:MAG: hypothetical protein IJK04_02515, partial [Kiritimatiellae bacterium]|nr:hypothetical protein [Kiritimatiellia bacterium]